MMCNADLRITGALQKAGVYFRREDYAEPRCTTEYEGFRQFNTCNYKHEVQASELRRAVKFTRLHFVLVKNISGFI